jgi:hypothetical protein
MMNGQHSPATECFMVGRNDHDARKPMLGTSSMWRCFTASV